MLTSFWKFRLRIAELAFLAACSMLKRASRNYVDTFEKAAQAGAAHGRLQVTAIICVSTGPRIHLRADLPHPPKAQPMPVLPPPALGPKSSGKTTYPVLPGPDHTDHFIDS